MRNNDLRTSLILEYHRIETGLDRASKGSHNFIVNTLPLEKLVNLKDEKDIIEGMGGKKRYVATQSNTYKLLGSMGTAGAGTKTGLEMGDIISAPDEATLATNLAGGAAGFLGGGYLGAKFGKDYGQSLAKKTYDTIYNPSPIIPEPKIDYNLDGTVSVERIERRLNG